MYMDHLNNNTLQSLGLLGTGNVGFQHYVDAQSGVLPFSAFHLLRNCNYLMAPPHSEISKSATLSELYNRLQPDHALHSPHSPGKPAPDCGKPQPLPPLTLDVGKAFPILSHHQPNLLSAHELFNNLHYHAHHGVTSVMQPTSPGSTLLSPDYMALKRHRGEKKPIPEEQKDEKYFERRKRNNQAAKKSRDARKIREDQVALKATILEHENAILKAQVLTLREEASSLRQMLLQKKSIEINS